MKQHKIRMVVAIVLLLALPQLIKAAEQNSRLNPGKTLDFGWSSPMSEKGSNNMVWPYRVANSNEKPVCAPIEIVMVSNKGAQYEDSSTTISSTTEGKKTKIPYRLSAASGKIYPGASKQETAIFKFVDNDIKWMKLYVSGLVVTSETSCESTSKIFKISYQRDGKDNWKLTNTEWLQ